MKKGHKLKSWTGSLGPPQLWLLAWCLRHWASASFLEYEINRRKAISCKNGQHEPKAFHGITFRVPAGDKISWFDVILTTWFLVLQYCVWASFDLKISSALQNPSFQQYFMGFTFPFTIFLPHLYTVDIQACVGRVHGGGSLQDQGGHKGLPGKLQVVALRLPQVL